MHIVYVSDGKAGHRSQAIGLYRAIQRQYRYDVSFQEIDLSELTWLQILSGILSKKMDLFRQTPGMIIGVGSHTQSRVLALGKIYPKAKTIILMKPNFPFAWFDHVVIPAHDGIAEKGNVILTQGALNPISNEERHQHGRILIALGGSSKRHVWNDEKVLSALESITQNHMDQNIILTTSRRTPKAFLAQLEAQPYAKNLQIFPVEETPQGWIFEEMQKAEAVWVTEDSVSMLYEALTAGCKVGVIAIDRLKEDRITRSVDLLLEQKKVSQGYQLSELENQAALQEADLVAFKVLHEN
jgi:uncharacterized protein